MTCYNMIRYHGLLILAFVTLSNSVLVESKQRIKLHIGALVPKLKQDDRYCFGSAIQVAIAEINNSSDLLKDYELVLHMKETKGHVGYTMESLYSLLYTGPSKIAIIGPGFSAPTKAVAEFGSVLGTLQITYSAVDPTLMSAIKYPFFFRSTPSVQSFNFAKVAFFRHFNWKHVALIYDYTSSLFFQTTDHLSKMLHSNNITTISIKGFGNDVSTQMDLLQKLDARILIGEFSKSGARKVFCEAYNRGMYGKKYVWIIMQGIPDNWYSSGNDISCNGTELLIASDGYFKATRSNTRRDGKDTIFHKTAETLRESIERQRESHLRRVKKTDFYSGSSFAFDATVALAMTLDMVMRPPHSVNLTSYTYKDYYKAYLMGDTLKRVQFEGISGSMRYDLKTRERLGEILIKQCRRGKCSTVARHKTSEDKLFIETSDLNGIFEDGHVPRDRAIIVRNAEVYSFQLIAAVWSTSLVGFLLAIAFLVINIKFRDVKIIKMSSPNINNIICVGCMLCYLSVFLYGLDSRLISPQDMPFNCHMISILLAVGFTLMFGGMFSKTWRVYKIFTASKNFERIKIKDLHLCGIIFLLFSIDVAIFIAWLISSPFKLTVIELEKTGDVANDKVTIPYVDRCHCDNQMLFTGSLYVYKGLLVIFGLFLAWETRGVTVAALNDSKYIGISVYNVCVLAILGVTYQMAIYNSNNHQVEYIVVAICVCLSTTTTLLLIFVPKLLMITRSEEETRASLSFSQSVRTMHHQQRQPSTCTTNNVYNHRYHSNPYLFQAQEVSVTTSIYDTSVYVGQALPSSSSSPPTSMSSVLSTVEPSPFPSSLAESWEVPEQEADSGATDLTK